MIPLPVLSFVVMAAVTFRSPPQDAGAEPSPPPLARLEGSGGAVVVFSADGARLLTAGGKEARVWDARTYRPLAGPLMHEADVRSAVLSPDGNRVATAGGMEARVWDAANGELLLTLKHADRVFDAAFSPDGKCVATACLDKSARIWHAATGELLSELKHEFPVRSVVFHPDGGKLLTGTVDPEPAGWDEAGRNAKAKLDDPSAVGDAYLWEIARKRDLWVHSCRGRPVFSPDGRWIGAPCISQGAVVCDATDGEVVTESLLGEFTTVAFSRDGRWMLAAGSEYGHENEGAAQVVDLTPLARRRTWDKKPPLPATRGLAVGDRLGSAAIGPDGRVVALAPMKGGRTAGAWEVAGGGQVLRLPEGSNERSGWVIKGNGNDRRTCHPAVVALSPDGGTAAFGFVQHPGGDAALTGIWAVPKPPSAKQGEARP